MSPVLRAIAGIVVGWVIFAFSAIFLFRITDKDPHTWPGWSYAVGSVLYGMLFATVAGWILAMIAKEKANQAAIILAVLIALSALASITMLRSGGSYWSPIATAILMAPMIVFGARFQQSKR